VRQLFLVPGPKKGTFAVLVLSALRNEVGRTYVRGFTKRYFMNDKFIDFGEERVAFVCSLSTEITWRFPSFQKCLQRAKNSQ